MLQIVVAYSLCLSLSKGHGGLYQLYVGALHAGCLPEPGDADAELIARMIKTTTPGVGNVGVAQPNITEACDELYSALEDICPSWPARYTLCPLMDNVEYVTSGMAVRSWTTLLLASLVIAFCVHSEVKDTIACDFMLATVQVRLFSFIFSPNSAQLAPTAEQQMPSDKKRYKRLKGWRRICFILSALRIFGFLSSDKDPQLAVRVCAAS